MNWKQVCIEAEEKIIDLVSSVLMDAGATGVEIDGGAVPVAKQDEYLEPCKTQERIIVKSYFGESNFDAVMADIKNGITTLADSLKLNAEDFGITVNTIEDTDWNANFKKHFTTFRAAGNIVIKPTWETYDAKEGEIVIEMDPGMAFGSGVHETTKMCLELIQKYMPEEANVLDVGCGSGILGIACSKLGAKEVLALDYDNVSVDVTAENAKRNGIDNLNARQSDLLQNADDRHYDIILANIIADVVIRLNEDVSNLLEADSIYIISGIIEDRLQDVLSSLERNKLDVIETLAMNDWRALAVRRRDA